MSPDELKARLNGNILIAEFEAVAKELGELPDDAVFHLLFPIATKFTGYADALAAALLLELEPRCPLTCVDALRIVGASEWQVSDGRVPFYLSLQFGKPRLLDAVKRVTKEFKSEAAHRVKTVGYWARFPSVSIMDGYMAERHRRLFGHADPGARAFRVPGET